VIAGRFLQGLAAAAFVPASLALPTAAFTRPGPRNRPIGVYGALAALGFVVGMVGGGVVTRLRPRAGDHARLALLTPPAARRPVPNRLARGPCRRYCIDPD